jgi:hypothetical protein
MDTELTWGYVNWLLIIGMTIGFFSLFSRKHKELGKLIALVLIPVWIIIAIVRGIEYMSFNNSDILFSSDGYLNLLAETLPILILFGGATFYFQYKKMKKANRL